MSLSNKATLRIDAERLASQARDSEDREAYVQLFRSDVCRVGVTAAADKSDRVSFSVEVLVMAASAGVGGMSSGLTNLMEAINALSNRGYAVDCQGDGWLVAWKILRPRDLDAELDSIAEIILKGERDNSRRKRSVKADG